MPTMYVHRPESNGRETVWISEGEMDWWRAFCNKHGWPTATVTEYKEWGGFFPPHPESVGDVMFYPKARRRLPRLSR